MLKCDAFGRGFSRLEPWAVRLLDANRWTAQGRQSVTDGEGETSMPDRPATPDGILRRDWDRVHELAVEIVNASCGDDEETGDRMTADLLQLLDDLEVAYGPLPSLLATRADYVEDIQRKGQLLHAAYDLAVERRDERNVLWIASSLAALYVEEIGDREQGMKWLAALEQHLATCPDENEGQELERLRTKAEGLER